ncbi:MAG: glycine/D-amino acid oxidase-like deaminating enzyme [Spirosomataceae bacterium]|jgi:gamma-glutamylputrescine oxidase
MKSIWESELLPQSSDVTIIGAGFSGLWTAFFLHNANPGLNIQLIDKESIPKGASSRNAGFACFGSTSELVMNIETMGEEKTLHWALERYRGIRLIKKHFSETIQYQNCGGYELFDDEELFEKCTKRISNFNDFFENFTEDKTTYEVSDKSIQKFNFKGFQHTILNTEEGSINSGLLLKELHNHLLVNGVKIYRGIKFVDYSVNNSNVSVETSFGEFKTKHFCFATNAFSPKSLNITPGRGQILLTKPIENLPFNGTFHVDKGYTYFRNVGNRILIGGGRNIAMAAETTNEYAVTETIQNYLESLLRERILPNHKFEVENRWSGIMGFTETHEPICEVQSPHVSVIAGMNGMGVALAPRLGEVLAGEIGNL